jgi:hypothetical protein
MATKYDFDLVKGETFSQRIIVRDENYNYYNLSGRSVSGFCKYAYCNSGYLLNLNASVYSSSSGIIDLLVDYTGTLNLPVTKLNYDINTFIGNLSENILYGYIYVYPGTVGTTN